MRTGTSHFISETAARAYYSQYDPDLTAEELAAWIRQKLQEGEIHIGEPTLKPGEKLSVIPGEGRYAIESK